MLLKVAFARIFENALNFERSRLSQPKTKIFYVKNDCMIRFLYLLETVMRKPVIAKYEIISLHAYC